LFFPKQARLTVFREPTTLPRVEGDLRGTGGDTLYWQGWLPDGDPAGSAATSGGSRTWSPTWACSDL